MKTANRLFVLFLAVLAMLASTNTVRAIEIVKSIPYDGVGAVIAYDSYKGAVWITTDYRYAGDDGIPFIGSAPTKTVAAISDSNYAVIANVTIGYAPIGIAYASGAHEVYVANQATGIISVVSDISNSVVATINSNHVGFLVYDSSKGEIFGSASEDVVVISEATRQMATIPLGDGPFPSCLIYDSGKGEIYVYRQSSDGENHFLSVISDETNSVVATVPLDSAVGLGTYDSATGEIYLPASNRSVLVVSDKNYTVTDSIQLEHSPLSVAYDPVKSVVFAGDAYNTTYIISDRTKSVIETVPISSVFMVYDTGKNLMIAIGNGSIQFVSDGSLPSVSSTDLILEFSIIVVLPLLVSISLVAFKVKQRKQRSPT